MNKIMDKDSWLNQALVNHELRTSQKVTRGGFSTLITCYYAGWDIPAAVQLLVDAKNNKRGGYREPAVRTEAIVEGETIFKAQAIHTDREAQVFSRILKPHQQSDSGTVQPLNRILGRQPLQIKREEVAHEKATGVRESVWDAIAKSGRTDYTATPTEQSKEEGRRQNKGRRGSDKDTGSGRANSRRSGRRMGNEDDSWNE